MRLTTLASVSAVLFTAGSLLAQEAAGNIAALEFQKPKNGMTTQYQNGRKQKAAWHKQQNDPLPLYVWEILSGDNTGTYVVGRMGQHWADFDKPAISEESDVAEFDKVVGSYVDSVVARFYEHLPKMSNSTASKQPAKFSEIVIFQVREGKGADFRSAIGRIYEAAQKTKWTVHYDFFELANGGPVGTYVLSVPHDSWADMQDKPTVKPFRDMLKEAFGQAEADSIVNRLNSSVERETSELIQFHPELSYLPST